MSIIGSVLLFAVGACAEAKEPQWVEQSKQAMEETLATFEFPYTIALLRRTLDDGANTKEVIVLDDEGELFCFRGGRYRHERVAEGFGDNQAQQITIRSYPDGEKVITRYAFSVKSGRRSRKYSLDNVKNGHLLKSLRHPFTYRMVFEPFGWDVEMKPKDIGFKKTVRTVVEGKNKIMTIARVSSFHIEGWSQCVLVNYLREKDHIPAILLGTTFSDIVLD